MTKLKIVSNGRIENTEVFIIDSDYSEIKIRNCEKIEFSLDAKTGEIKARLTLFNLEIDTETGVKNLQLKDGRVVTNVLDFVME